MKWELVDGAESLRAAAAEWDELWLRSGTALPTARAIPLTMWCEYFAPRASLQAVLIRDAGRLVAALPLVLHGRFPRVARFPFNDWLPGGALLVDEQYETPAVAERLLDGLLSLSCHAFWLRHIPWNSPHWRNLVAAAEQRRLSCAHHRLHEVGLVDLRRSWAEIKGGFSRNFRHHVRHAERRAEQAGGVELAVLETFGPGELERYLRAGFELEASGWKGRAGTSVLQQPGFFEFLVRQAEELARNGEVRLVFLRLCGKPIAFEYCWRAKGRLFTPKIAYDETYPRLSPGHFLMRMHLQELTLSRSLCEIDFVGPLADYCQRWCTGAYETRTIVLGQPGLMGRTLVSAYRLRRAWKERGNEPRHASLPSPSRSA